MNGIAEVMRDLRRQREAIEEALLALERVFGPEGEAARVNLPAMTTGAPVKATRKGRPVKDRRSEGQKRRWAAKKAAESIAADTPAPASRLTPEGRKKLADAMKRRWAVKRAAGKKRGPKKAA